MSNDLRCGRHVVYNLHVHLVFVAKYRRKVFTKEILDDMRGILESVCTDFEAQLVEFEGEDDHVHLLVNYPPKVSICISAPIGDSRISIVIIYNIPIINIVPNINRNTMKYF